jgi:hypothetical protein
MSSYSRRKLLATIGSGISCFLSGCSRIGKRPHIVLSMSSRLKQDLTEDQQLQTFNVCEKYVVQALKHRFNNDIQVEFNSKPYKIRSEDKEGMLNEFESSVGDRRSEISHICLCSDVSGKKSSGRAEIQRNNCDIRSKDTNLGVVTSANWIHNRSRLETEATLRIRDSEIFDHYFANYALGILIHEIGHNLCLTHSSGKAWYGTEAPEKYNPVRNEKNIYLSPMMGLYYYAKGGAPSITDKENNIPDFTGSETIHYGTIYH